MDFDRMGLLRGMLLASTAAIAMFPACVPAQIYNLRVLHRFSDPRADGGLPAVGVRFDGAGNLFGTTLRGGLHDGGTIYKIANDGIASVLYDFKVPPAPPQQSAPADPRDVVIDAATGDLYGTTAGAPDGHVCQSGCGQIYKLTADGIFVVLHTFADDSGGFHPSALTRDPQGNLYGTNNGGGDQGVGTVFEYAADGTFRVLHTFAESDGYRPVGPVFRNAAGNLYGVTMFGAGRTNCGTIYRLASDGAFTILHKFGRDPAVDDGCYPNSLVADQFGNFYGTTGRTVFKFASDGTFTTLRYFTIQPGYGINPVLPVNGALYGTVSGLADAPGGVLFKIDLSNGAYTEPYHFSLGSGVAPMGRLTLQSGRLYGVTYGAIIVPPGVGTVFSFGVANP